MPASRVYSSPTFLEDVAAFVRRLEENEALADQLGVFRGECSRCQEQRHVRYSIMFDALFCSPRCSRRYKELIGGGR